MERDCKQQPSTLTDDVAVPRLLLHSAFILDKFNYSDISVSKKEITWGGCEMERGREQIGSPFVPFSKECPEQPWDSFLAAYGWWKKVKQIVGASLKNRGRYWARECCTLLPSRKYEAVLELWSWRNSHEYISQLLITFKRFLSLILSIILNIKQTGVSWKI